MSKMEKNPTRMGNIWQKHESSVEDTMYTVNGIPIKKVPEFRYLGRILQNEDSDWAAIQRALQRAKVMWGRMGRILSNE
jgi:hypothetical protein